MKVLSITVPEWVEKKEIEKLIEEYLNQKGNLDLVLKLRGCRMDENSVKKIDEMMEKWKESSKNLEEKSF